MLVDIHTVNMASMHTCSTTNLAFSEYYAGLTSSAKPKHCERVFTCAIKMANDEPRRSPEENIQVDPKDLQFYSDSYDEPRKF